MSAAVRNWGLYIESLRQTVMTIEEKVYSSSVDTVCQDDYALLFKDVQKLALLGDKLVMAKTVITGQRGVLSKCSDLHGTLLQSLSGRCDCSMAATLGMLEADLQYHYNEVVNLEKTSSMMTQILSAILQNRANDKLQASVAVMHTSVVSLQLQSEQTCQDTANLLRLSTYETFRSKAPGRIVAILLRTMSTYYRETYDLHWKSTPGAEVSKSEADAEKFNFLSFLATAQALEIQFLPIAWDASGTIGGGGTSFVHQILVNANTSFAFKTCYKQNKTEAQIFRALITEIAILSQPFVRDHANIVQLHAISWDISREDDKPWPVLVFEKSHLGDLYHFARHGGRDMTLEERLSFCADIGKAIVDMHSNHIIHGDLKPENVLVFKDDSGRYSARVIDFGFSTRYADEDQLLTLPRSEPWNAPENNGHVDSWTPRRAVKADLYCFGVLCFWLLFEPLLCRTTASSQTEKGSTYALRSMRRDLLRHAQDLLKSETAFKVNMRTGISEFFTSSLSQDPEKRAIDCIQRFLSILDPEW
ncbi:hypothetical protein V2A60_009624 [Cordyceps javanica]